MKNIIFIAPPAAGKGTMSECLIAKYQYKHISTGDILREMAKGNDENAIKLKDMLASGKLVPEEIVCEALKRRLIMDDMKGPFILDGFPRNINQAKEYENILAETGNQLGVVIYLDIPKDILERRIVGRRICSKCGATYNILTGVNMPQKENVCDKCGSALYQRDDDNLESFKVRYETFLQETFPVLDYYAKQNVLFKITSSDVQEVVKEIEAIIHD